jgi:hypothetical protein
VRAQLPNYTREQADFLARRLYQAVLGRAVDPAGLTQTIAELQRGNLERHVTGLVGSREFQQNVGTRQPAAILEQIYRGLLGRLPDSGGVSTYLGDVERRRYVDVVVRIVESPEFERLLPGGPRRAPGPGPGMLRPDAPDRGFDAGGIRLAMRCQDAVLDRMRADRGERMFVRFGEPEFARSGRAEEVRGTGTDLMEGDRPFRYGCEIDRVGERVGEATYSFEGSFWDPVARVPVLRACEDAVRREVRGPRDLVFESAGISPVGPGDEIVRGRAREISGWWNQAFGRVYDFTCDVRGGRITNATVRSPR